MDNLSTLKSKPKEELSLNPSDNKGLSVGNTKSIGITVGLTTRKENRFRKMR